MKKEITVRADVPVGATHKHIQEFVRDALSSWGGQFSPDDLLFRSLKVKSVKVQNVKPKKIITTRYFTFGQDHTSHFPLPRGGKLGDYWVAVESDEDDHRELFIDQFASKQCPRPEQFGFEYREGSLGKHLYLRGELLRIKAR